MGIWQGLYEKYLKSKQCKMWDVNLEFYCSPPPPPAKLKYWYFSKSEIPDDVRPSSTSLLIKIQPDAAVCRYIFTAKSLYMFRLSQHPSSGVLKTVTPASGTGHNTGGLIRTGLCESHKPVPIKPRWREVAVPVLWPVPEAAVTVFSTPDDGCCDTRSMYVE